MRVHVFGEDELARHLNNGGEHYSHCISIGNPGMEIIPEIKKYYCSTNILRLEFFDLEEPLPEHERVPEMIDMAKIFHFYSSTRNIASGYTIHCYRGVSRSTAVALCILYLIHEDEKFAGEELQRIRSEAVPLPRIVKFFDDVVGSSLIDECREIRYRRIEAMKKELEAISFDDILMEIEDIEIVEPNPIEFAPFLEGVGEYE